MPEIFRRRPLRIAVVVIVAAAMWYAASARFTGGLLDLAVFMPPSATLGLMAIWSAHAFTPSRFTWRRGLIGGAYRWRAGESRRGAPGGVFGRVGSCVLPDRVQSGRLARHYMRAGCRCGVVDRWPRAKLVALANRSTSPEGELARVAPNAPPRHLRKRGMPNVDLEASERRRR
jgi:hypothetical protein